MWILAAIWLASPSASAPATEPGPRDLEMHEPTRLMWDLNLEGGENRVDLDLLGAPEGEHAGAIDLDLGHEDTATTGESPALREGEVGLDFVVEKPGRGSDGSATTREMAARTMETPTIETEYTGGRDSPTTDSPSLRERESTTIREKLSTAMRQNDEFYLMGRLPKQG